MLFYLDNSRSIGPKSVAGLVNTRGLNENLAREILELHTLGVRSVYTQDDVTSFAKVLTGWTIIPAATNPDRGGEFVFNPRMHEPGPQTVIGKVYAQPDAAQGRAVLADLARHPATAAHVARKLARHFSADEPPPALVQRLEQVLPRHRRRSEGDRQGADRGAGNLERGAHEAQAAERVADLGVARDRRRARSAARIAGDGLSRRADVAAERPAGLPRRAGGLDRRARAAARPREPHRRTGAGARSSLRRSSRRRSGRSPRPRRGRPSRAPKAASRG